MSLVGDGGEAVIGVPVVGGTANSVIFIDASGKLAQDNPGFTYIPGTGLSLDDNLTIKGTITSGDITIFDATPILVFQDSNSLGAASVGFIEWRDSGGGRAGFFGNSSSGNDDLIWKNEQGGNIGIQTTGAGDIQLGSAGNIDCLTNDIVNAGTITAAQIIDNGLTASKVVFTDASKQLTSTAITSGDGVFWNRTGTVLSPITAGDDIQTTGDYHIGSVGLTDTVHGSSGSSLIGIGIGSGSPTVDQIEERYDNIGSSGYFTGGILSDGGLGTLDITAGEGFIRATADDNAPLLSFSWDAVTGMAIPDDTTQYVFVDDNGVVSINASEFIEEVDKIMIGVVTDEAGAISHTFNLGVRLEESIGQAGRFIRRVLGVSRDIRKGGLIFGQSGDANRDVTVSAGSLWWGRTEYPIAAFNTAGADTFDTYSAGGQEATGASQWPNAQYDNAGTLTTMINNRWAVLWFYIEPDGHIVMVYGRAQYVTEGQAEDELPPADSLPNRITSASVLAAKFIFQKSDDIATKIESAFGVPFTSAGVTDHGNLAGLGDDDHTQYLLADGSRGLSANWDAGNFEIRTRIFESDVATGTPPLTIASTTVVSNLNADLLDGQHASSFLTSESDTLDSVTGRGNSTSNCAGFGSSFTACIGDDSGCVAGCFSDGTNTTCLANGSSGFCTSDGFSCTFICGGCLCADSCLSVGGTVCITCDSGCMCLCDNSNSCYLSDLAGGGGGLWSDGAGTIIEASGPCGMCVSCDICSCSGCVFACCDICSFSGSIFACQYIEAGQNGSGVFCCSGNSGISTSFDPNSVSNITVSGGIITNIT